jgi:hypothetical protein
MLNFCGIVAAILKMVTGRNFSMSEVVRFFATYGLARNKNRLCKGWDNRIVQKQQQKTHKIKKKRNQNVSRTCSFKF